MRKYIWSGNQGSVGFYVEMPNSITLQLPEGYIDVSSNEYWELDGNSITGGCLYENNVWKSGNTNHDLLIQPIGSWASNKKVVNMIVHYTSTGGEILDFFGRTVNDYNAELPWWSTSDGYSYISGSIKPWYDYDADSEYPETTPEDMILGSLNFWSNIPQAFNINAIYLQLADI